jgi:hypothetical protein
MKDAAQLAPLVTGLAFALSFVFDCRQPRQLLRWARRRAANFGGAGCA